MLCQQQRVMQKKQMQKIEHIVKKKAGKYSTKINPKIYRNCNATKRILSEMDEALRYTLLTLFKLFTLLCSAVLKVLKYVCVCDLGLMHSTNKYKHCYT